MRIHILSRIKLSLSLHLFQPLAHDDLNIGHCSPYRQG
ncbi:hypothetical protein SAMN05444507_10656 [Pseudomonas syringae]|nr:hypothetical protein SAMN05444507_10656 [Pseudomonas syringae]